ncbi:MAG TPA: hypothetical protein VEY51_03215 [Chondromyces sp.]|nr:hypothetical protein [Chondromyces sp.]
MKQKYMLLLLLVGLMLYYAAPRFDVRAEGAEGIFSISWLLLALMVVAGNLSAFLQTPSASKKKIRKIQKPKRKIRSYS